MIVVTKALIFSMGSAFFGYISRPKTLKRGSTDVGTKIDEKVSDEYTDLKANSNFVYYIGETNE